MLQESLVQSEPVVKPEPQPTIAELLDEIATAQGRVKALRARVDDLIETIETVKAK